MFASGIGVTAGVLFTSPWGDVEMSKREISGTLGNLGEMVGGRVLSKWLLSLVTH